MVPRKLSAAVAACLLAGLLFVAPACQSEATDPAPTPPSMDDVARRFSKPSAPLTAETAVELLQVADKTAKFLDSMGGATVLQEALAAMFGSDETEVTQTGSGLEARSSAIKVGGTTIEGEGYLDLTRICGGALPGSVPDPANGSITMTGVFGEAGISPVFWGQLLKCRYLAKEVPILADGAFRMLVGDGSPITGPIPQYFTVAIDADFTIDQVKQAGQWFFRFLPDGGYELNLDIPSGNVIIFGGLTAGFRAANGLWTCDFEKGKCTSDSGTSLSLW